MIKFCFYVPESHLASVKAAIFAAGAGVVGDYSQCCWQVVGTGQFFADTSANPSVGKSAEFTELDEYKVEVLCKRDSIKDVVASLIASHPYEEPVYTLEALLSVEDL